MPIYEYHCSTCDERVEVLMRSSAASPSCPECGSLLRHKLFSAAYVLSGRTRRPKGRSCCGEHEDCDGASCACEGECRHG